MWYLYQHCNKFSLTVPVKTKLLFLFYKFTLKLDIHISLNTLIFILKLKTCLYLLFIHVHVKRHKWRETTKMDFKILNIVVQYVFKKDDVNMKKSGHCSLLCKLSVCNLHHTLYQIICFGWVLYTLLYCSIVSYRLVKKMHIVYQKYCMSLLREICSDMLFLEFIPMIQLQSY